MSGLFEEALKNTQEQEKKDKEVEDQRYVQQMVDDGVILPCYANPLSALIRERRYLEAALSAPASQSTLENVIYAEGEEPLLLKTLEGLDRIKELNTRLKESVFEVLGEIGVDIALAEFDATKKRPETHDVYPIVKKLWGLASQRVPIFESQKPIPLY